MLNISGSRAIGVLTCNAGLTPAAKLIAHEWVLSASPPFHLVYFSMLARSAIASALRHLAPRLPAHEFDAVIDHAVDSPGLRVASPENAAWLSLVAYARHTMTDYDALLAEGYDRDSARFFVADELADLLAGWGVRRKLTPEE